MTLTDGIRPDHWGLLGHDWVVDMLKQQIIQDTLCHAYLISGAPGVGRRTLALRFAQALCCPNPLAPAEPCRDCRTCRQVERMQYPDLTVLEAEKEGGDIKVEWVRKLRQSLWLTPYQGKYRLALLNRFQDANDSAANALLKTLEEPPSHVILMLTADAPEQLPATITSRCEILRLRPSPAEAVEDWLLAKKIPAGQARLLAHISGGRPGAALRWLQDTSALDARRERLDDLLALLKATRTQRFAYADKKTSRRKKEKEVVIEDPIRQTLLVWLSLWRDVLLQITDPAMPVTNIDYQDDVVRLSGLLTMEQARQAVRNTEDALERLEKNVNARLLVEVHLLDLPFLP